MSFLKKSLKALGFSDEEEQEPALHTANDSHTRTGTPAGAQAHTHAGTHAPSQAGARTDAGTGAHAGEPDNTAARTGVLPDKLLERVVELVNASLPEFVRSCIDHESEKKYIYEHLGDSFKNYIAELDKQAHIDAENRIAETRQKLEGELAALKHKTTELEEQKTEIKNAQLSAERQKRALHDKVHDLDNRVSTLEAEKEQYELENKSLLNKLKVAGVKQQELDDAMSENARLLEVIQELKQQAAQDGNNAALAAKQAELDALQQKASGQDAALAAKQAELDALQQKATEQDAALAAKQAELDALQQEHHTLQAAADRHAAQDTALEQARNELQQARDSMEQLNGKLAEREAESNALSEKCSELQNLIDSRTQRCTELETALTDLRAGEHESRMEADNTAARLTALRDEYASLQQEHDTLTAQLAEYKRQNTRLTGDADNIRTERDSLNTRLADALNAADSLKAAKDKAEEENDALRTRVNTLQERLDSLAKQAAEPANASRDELDKARNMIDALKKQRQELISQTATLRSENKKLQNQLATRDNAAGSTPAPDITFDIEIPSLNIAGNSAPDDPSADTEDDNWMKPVLPSRLEEEARRREEEKRREDEEKARAAEKEKQIIPDTSSQMCLW